MTGEEPAISRRRAFLVHFKAGTDINGDRLAGRVEHVASGRALHFDGRTQLLAFVARVLGTLKNEPDGEILPGNNP
jgi:hypothetical protein